MELLNAEIDRDEARQALHDARHEIERLREDRTEALRMLYILVIELVGENCYTQLGSEAAYAEALDRVRNLY